MPFIISINSRRIVTLQGDIFNIEARKPTYVAARVLEEAIKQGCAECDEHGNLGLTPEIAAKLPPPVVPDLNPEQRNDSGVRKHAIRAAIAQLVEKGDRRDFTEDNIPKTVAIKKIVGFPVTNAEVREIITALEATT